MLEFNNNDDKQSLFFDICSFLDTYNKEIIFIISCFIFSLLKIFGLNQINWFYKLGLSFLFSCLIVQIIFVFTVDRQYNIIYKKYNFLFRLDELEISKEDELLNATLENPEIPGLNISYELLENSNDKYALAFKINDSTYRIVSLMENDSKGKYFQKIKSNDLLNALNGLTHKNIIENNCLIFKIIKIKNSEEVLENASFIKTKDIDLKIVITECLFYPYVN